MPIAPQDNKQAITRMVALRPDEVSLVSRGAVGRLFLVVKSQTERSIQMPVFSQDVLELLSKHQLSQSVAEALGKLNLSEDDAGAGVFKGLVLAADAFRDKFPKSADAAKAAMLALGVQMPTAEETLKAVPAPDLVKTLMSLPADTLKTLREAFTAPPEDAALKALPADVQKAILDEREKTAAALKRLEDAEKLRTVEKATEEVRNTFKAIAANPEKLGPIFADLRKSAPKAAEELFALLKSADAALVESGLFAEKGAGGSVNSGAWERVCKMADDLMKKEQGKYTTASAREAVLSANADLAQEVRDEDARKRKGGV